MYDFWAFALVGFLAQLVDGALGMGFGVISASVLLAQGIPPALASASVNAAKLPTTGTAAISHFMHKNLDWRIIIMLCIFGALGGMIGATVLTSLKGKTLFVMINIYLLLIGGLIIYRAVKDVAPRLIPGGFTRLIGFAGGLIEGIGGSWGPVVTTSLLGAGTESRYAIGSSNFAEFVVSIAVFSTFVAAFAVGHWEGGSDWHEVTWPVAGLILGGLPAAAIGGYLSKIAPKRPLTIAVGLLAISIGIYRFATM
ncbi:MAG: sulfite exporter TauE/SafE family protein [Aestuariivirga sp.]